MSLSRVGKRQTAIGQRRFPPCTASAILAEMEPYESDVAYIEAQLRRLELRIEARLPDKDPGSEARATAALTALEQQIADRVAASRRVGRLPAAERLAEEYGLSRFELDLLIVALAPGLELRFADLYDRIAYKYRGRTVDTALTILCENFAQKVAARRYFMLDAPLVMHHLLFMERDRYRNEEDILNLELKLPRRVMNLMLGADAIDESLASFSKLIEPTVSMEQVVLDPNLKQQVLGRVKHHAQYLEARKAWGFDRVITYGRGIILLFSGPPGTGKTMLANALAQSMGKRLLLVNADRLYDRVHTLESNVENVFREAKLQNSLLFFDECEMLFADRRFGNNGVGELLTALERFDGVAVLATNLAPALDEAMDRRILLRVDFEMPTADLRERIWRAHLPAEAPLAGDVDVRTLAEQFEFTGGYIKNAVLAALQETVARGGPAPRITMADLTAACRMQLRNKLTAYTDRIVPQVGLATVVLPAPLKEAVAELIDATKHQSLVFGEWGLGARLSQGRGLASLFQGPPGTGKSLTAEAVAYELGRNLFRVSLPAVVSKYVGETEKNLRDVFDAARDGRAVLFFDEADALLSRRTAVANAIDKYSNMETNLLLQEMERFDGLLVLATNLVGNLDGAFERRIAYKLTFSLPDVAAREAIWRGLVPPEMPTAEPIDFAYLGRKYNLSGGEIKNAVVKAAYRAARKGPELRMLTTQLLAQAADEETHGFQERKRIGFGAAPLADVG